MSKDPEDSEFTLRPNTNLDDLKSFLSGTLDVKTGVTCPSCGNRVEGSFKDLLRGVQCTCGEAVRAEKFEPPKKGKRKQEP
jgi:hypothetical protein